MEPSRYAQQNSDEKLRILVVDDDLSLRKILHRILENGGYDVLSAASGEEALALCRRSNPAVDLLITDYNMPGMTGLELAREYRATDSAMRVIHMSGASPDEALRDELAKPGRRFLAKPFRRDDLLRACDEILTMEPEANCSAARMSL